MNMIITNTLTVALMLVAPPPYALLPHPPEAIVLVRDHD